MIEAHFIDGPLAGKIMAFRFAHATHTVTESLLHFRADASDDPTAVPTKEAVYRRAMHPANQYYANWFFGGVPVYHYYVAHQQHVEDFKL